MERVPRAGFRADEIAAQAPADGGSAKHLPPRADGSGGLHLCQRRPRDGGRAVRRVLLCALVALAATQAHASAPCEGVERGQGAPPLSARVAAQLHDPKARALRPFAYDGWEIVEVAQGDAQDAFVFYSADPLSSD